MRPPFMESSCNLSVNPLGLNTWSHQVQQYGVRPAFGKFDTRTRRNTSFNHGVSRWTSFCRHVDSSAHPTFDRLFGRLSCRLAGHLAGRLFFVWRALSHLGLPELSKRADAAAS